MKDFVIVVTKPSFTHAHKKVSQKFSPSFFNFPPALPAKNECVTEYTLING
jgi:hypothetical protein